MARTKGKWLPIEIASQIVQHYGCSSRDSFWEWWEKYRPSNIPKQPNRAYDNWVNWNEFLGTNNEFRTTRREWRRYWDAVRWAQAVAKQNNLTSYPQWKRWCDDNGMPEDIPKMPDRIYKDEWQGWGVWLGKDIQSSIKVAEQTIPVAALVTYPREVQPNIVDWIVVREGVDHLKARIAETNAKVYRAYVWDKEATQVVDDIFNYFARKQNDGLYVVPNVNALIFELDQTLEWLR